MTSSNFLDHVVDQIWRLQRRPRFIGLSVSGLKLRLLPSACVYYLRALAFWRIIVDACVLYGVAIAPWINHHSSCQTNHCDTFSLRGVISLCGRWFLDWTMQAVTCRSDSLPMALYDWKALGLPAIFPSIDWAQETRGKVKCATRQLKQGACRNFCTWLLRWSISSFSTNTCSPRGTSMFECFVYDY